MSDPIAPAAPYPPNAELVGLAWLAQRVPELNDSMVGTSLPKDVTAWGTAGFVQLRDAVGGIPVVDYPLRRSILQLDAWANTPGSNKPPWNLAARLVEVVRLATESPMALYGRPVDMPDDYGNVRVQAVFYVTEPRRIFDDPSGYARFTADLEVDWAPIP